jgi:hypothetical protein
MKPPLAGEAPGRRRDDNTSDVILAGPPRKENRAGAAVRRLLDSLVDPEPGDLSFVGEISMNASTDVPVTITPEAAVRLDELGMHKELEQMIAHAREVVPGLAAIEVEIAERYDTGGEPGINITAYSDQVFLPGDSTSWDLIRWDVETFPPQVLEHLCILLSPGKPHAR